MANELDFKKHSKLYYWWQRKKELWHYIWYGKLFICKTLINENKEVGSEWYLYIDKDKLEWRPKPQMYYGYIMGALLVLRLRKEDGNENITYDLVTVGDYAFLTQITQSK